MDISLLITADNIKITNNKELTLDENYLFIRFNNNIAKGKYLYNDKEYLIDYDDIDINDLIDFNMIKLIELPLDFPGNTLKQKIGQYFSIGIASVLIFFGLVQKEPKLFGHLEIIFPDVMIDINILNKKFYRFFKTYINFLESMNNDINNDNTILKSNHIIKDGDITTNNILLIWIKFIDKFWDDFGDLIQSDLSVEMQQSEDMLCIHASTLGYSKFLEKRITYLIQSLNIEKDKVLKDIQNHNLSIDKYYNEEILKMAEKLVALKNIHQDLINDTKDAIKKTKHDMEIFNNKNQREFMDIIKKDVTSLLDTKRIEISDEFKQISKRNIIELERSLNNIENQQIQKLRDIINDMNNKKGIFNRDLIVSKTQIIEDINYVKNDSIAEINKLKINVIKDSEDIKSKIDIYWNKIQGFNDNLESKIQDINDFKNNKIEEYWEHLLDELKKQSRLIIQDALSKALEDLGTALEEQIEKRIEKKINEIMKIK